MKSNLVKLDVVRKIIFFFVLVWVLAGVRVRAEDNNKFGMHVAVPTEEELKEVAQLVNSSGGDWGYVTVVMQVDDLSHDKWQAVFDQMRELHLIPIVRLATRMKPGGYWEKPKEEDIDVWVEFLDSLNWVTKNRYLVLFNEPNQAKEWGGAVNPTNFAHYTYQLAKKLKNSNDDYFLMLAGFDAAAPDQMSLYADEEIFLRQMNQALDFTDFFEYIDGWATHSYPNHGFIGLPNDYGRNSIVNYEWELQILRSLGVKKELPVFITETGWPHSEGAGGRNNYYSVNQIAEFYKIYFQRILPDNRVRAITPFIFNYQEEPFDSFSWKKLEEDGYYPQYEVFKAIDKVEGQPEQEQRLEIFQLPPAKLIRDSTYKFDLEISNQGQAIWDRDQEYRLSLIGENSDQFEYFFSNLRRLKPRQTQTVTLFLKTKQTLDEYNLSFAIFKGDEVVSNKIDWLVQVRPSIDLKLSIAPFLWRKQQGDDFEFLIYDGNEEVVFRKADLTVKMAEAEVENIDSITFSQEYRLVLVRPRFLPRQTFITFEESQDNRADFDPLLPIDFNSDGKFSWADIKAVLYLVK